MNFRDKLRSHLKSKRVAVALSGGVDSSALLAFCADFLGSENCLAITAHTLYMMARETSYAEKLAARFGVKFLKIEIGADCEILKNPKDRCYVCKKFLFEKLKKIAAENGFEILADGTNLDDTKDYRPGMMALRELGVASPFLECAITKDEIRDLAKSYNLEVSEKPAYACLLTRFEHGREVSEEMLRRVDCAEEFLQDLGFLQVRVRVHSNLARIEIARDKFGEFMQKREEICRKMSGLGFKYVSLDLNGYRQGAMNEKD